MRAPVRGDDRGAHGFNSSAVLVVPPATTMPPPAAAVVPAVVPMVMPTAPTVPPPVVTCGFMCGEVIPSHGCCPLLQIRTPRPNTTEIVCNRDNFDQRNIPPFTGREDSIFSGFPGESGCVVICIFRSRCGQAEQARRAEEDLELGAIASVPDHPLVATRFAE